MASFNLFYVDRADDKIYKIDQNTNQLDSFPTPGAWSSGLGIDMNGYLWNCDDNSQTIYQLDTQGNVQAQYAAVGACQGITTDPDNKIWYAIRDEGNRTVYQVEVNDQGGLTTLNSFGVPNPTQNDPRGLTFGLDHLWLAADRAGADDSFILKLDTQGNLIDKFVAPGIAPEGLTMDPDGLLWHVDHDTDDLYGSIDPNDGSFLSAQGVTTLPKGLTLDTWIFSFPPNPVLNEAAAVVTQ